MEKFDHYLELLSTIGNDGATRSKLERCKQGFFADKLALYSEHKIIRVEKSDDPRDDMFYLTQRGLSLWRQELSIEDIMGGQ